MNVLIAEDDNTMRLVLGATLEKLGHKVTAAADGRKAWAAWQRERFPLVLTDWMMPEASGLELTRLIRAERQLDYSYIILLRALDSRSNFHDGMAAGVDDFLTKPFDHTVLAARLHVAERILALHEKLRNRAMVDDLTELSNRPAILEGLSQALARSTRDSSGVGVLLADIDHFKHINDSYGHPAGDAVLHEVAQRMQAPLRGYDRIGRYGGEEFLIVTPGCDGATALAIAERIRSSVGSVPIAIGDTTVSVGISIGVVVSRPGDALATLIAAADAALYRAKTAGRNRVEIADVPAGQ